MRGIESAAAEVRAPGCPAPRAARDAGSVFLRPTSDTRSGGVVAREPPGEEARHAVDARAGDAELVADVEDADRPSGGAGVGLGRAARGPDDGPREREEHDEARAHEAEGEGAVAGAGRSARSSSMKRPSRMPQPLNETGNGLHRVQSGTIRKQAESGQGDAQRARDRVVVAAPRTSGGRGWPRTPPRPCPSARDRRALRPGRSRTARAPREAGRGPSRPRAGCALPGRKKT